jgi:predicted metal-dependent hydrolase
MANDDRFVTIDGVTLALRITRKRVKNINARLVGGELLVSAPRGIPEYELAPLIRELGRRLVRRERARMVNSVDDALALARRVARRFPDPPAIEAARFSTNQCSRWGSFSLRTRTIHLNAALRQMPTWVLEAVVAHELAHVVHPDHSARFWVLLRDVCPETDRARAFLEGVTWLAGSWERLPPVERGQLGAAIHDETNGGLGSRERVLHTTNNGRGGAAKEESHENGR